MKYYLIAGERSGDMHAANLMKAVLNENNQAEFRFWGGDEMQKVGGTMVRHYREMAFMGLVEVLANLRTILGFIKECKKDILNYKPDAIVLVDYAGFNLRIARFVKQNLPGTKVFFYISPKVWAWNPKRALKVKASVDQMYVILPFEVDFYKKYDYAVEYVGNPLLDAVAGFQPDPEFRKKNNLTEAPVIALLPGSRKQEVKRLLGVMCEAAKAFPRYQFIVAGVNNLPRELYEVCQGISNMKVIYEQTYALLSIAEAALVTSGTATLETGLFEVPQVVVYKTNPITYFIGKRLVVIPYFSLVNLVAEKEIVKELLQGEVTPAVLIEELKKIIQGGNKREQLLIEYRLMKEKLGKPGASEKVGKSIVRKTMQA